MAFRDIVFPIEFLNIHQYCGFDSVLAGLSYYRIGGQQKILSKDTKALARTSSNYRGIK